jgi:hypothetical protein
LFVSFDEPISILSPYYSSKNNIKTIQEYYVFAELQFYTGAFRISLHQRQLDCILSKDGTQ